ncbi:MAG: helix-turn-helix transcriptional regulator [Nostoc sp.]|uniref:helix-turn-helix domain-containing protein n=1 Tax=Nostoc sp. TaxID=1180 RepID=UPI002FFBD9C6
MTNTQPRRFKTITEYHRMLELPKPEHPLISVINLESIKYLPPQELINLVFDFYTIALKRTPNTKYKYGQQEYDFDEGVMFFMSPGQVFGVEIDKDAASKRRGWSLLIHPDFLWNTSLAKTIKRYQYFNYSVNEALHLSEKEEAIINDIIENMEQEYRSNIDNFSQDVIVSQLELLLNYSNRFYHRQFITRKKASSDLLVKLEDLLNEYFDSQNELQSGIPSVKYIAGKLNVSPNYLSDMLRTLTGQNAQQHIHNKLIEKAKEALSTTSLSVSEIAYRLGFEHPQSFNKLFKNKTSVSPLEFRNSFN